MLKSIFINKNSQVRSGWKIATVFSSFFICINIIIGVIVFFYTIFEVASKRVSPDNLVEFTKDLNSTLTNINSPLGLSCNLIQCICMILFIILFWKVFDKKPIREIGLINVKNGYKDLIKGLILGAVSLSIVFLILYITGNVTLINPLSKPNFSLSLVTGLISFIFVGINEEMFARGYCMTVLKQTGCRWVTVIISSIIFSLMHSLNPGISLLSYLNLFLFGLLTAYMFIKSKNLWLSIGYHITWNYFEGNIFGFLVSGQTASGVYNLKNPVDNIINGGKFGPEGGVVVTLITLVGLIYMWKFYKPTVENDISSSLDLN